MAQFVCQLVLQNIFSKATAPGKAMFEVSSLRPFMRRNFEIFSVAGRLDFYVLLQKLIDK